MTSPSETPQQPRHRPYCGQVSVGGFDLRALADEHPGRTRRSSRLPASTRGSRPRSQSRHAAASAPRCDRRYRPARRREARGLAAAIDIDRPDSSAGPLADVSNSPPAFPPRPSRTHGPTSPAALRSRCARSRRPSPCPPSGRRASSSSETRAPRSVARAPASPRSTGTP